MKFLLALTTLIAATASAAQTIAIGAPLERTSISPGSSMTVEVDRPNSLTGSQEIAIVIALSSCASRGGCANYDVTQILGSVLYSGPYAPAYQTVPGAGWKPPYQNFTVKVPESLPKGQASLTVSHFSLIGAGPYPSLEVRNVTLNVV
ncbi:hypothetical protein NLI96_g8601 [Meripilus lineatus]|uniref:Secreted protein n=1 Tax=Meripilus lineatus TaxID=2056292 RepID=A0AAD5V280_9APHY|nr:hypothetical protein NLI96_g8601 [Physisporinus lineatus]